MGVNSDFLSGKSIMFNYTSRSKLTIDYSSMNDNTPFGFCTLHNISHLKISKVQEELLLRHSIFGLLIIKHIHQLIVEGEIIPKNPESSLCSIPICKSCLSGKAKCMRLKRMKNILDPQRSRVVKKGDLKLGDNVRTDNMSIIKGRLSYTRGHDDPYKMMSGDILFVDHAMGCIHIYNQVSLGIADAIRSKKLYKLQAEDLGVKVKIYHGDNEVFKSKTYKEYLEKRRQEILYLGLGSHGKIGWLKESSRR